MFVNSVVSRDSVYIKACRSAIEDESAFQRFKGTPEYYTVLEHVNQDTGNEYLNYIRDHYPTLLQPEFLAKCKQNDAIGSPRTYKYPETGDISPTTLRYMKVLGDLELHFGSLTGLNIVEIGGGYGGQCFVIGQRFLDVKSYTLIDLPIVTQLVDKYLTVQSPELRSKCLLVPADQLQEQDTKHNKWDLVISNYAFSECDTDVRTAYVETVINRSEHGYLTINYLSPDEKEALYTQLRLPVHRPTLKIAKELPSTHVDNLIVVW